MRIQNNIPAMNTHRYYNIANNAVASSAEKLSSGYRINRAGDDAAGLAISEKMRAQIRGLNMASKNGSDAISLIQTAEGALQSTHNILQRMRELAVQSASDTNEQVIDRGALQQEFEALQAEIDDVATTTRFNDQNLLDGTFQKIRSTLDNPGTDLAGVNAVSVARAKSGIYEMTVTNTAAQEAKIIDPGAQTEIFQDDMLALAGSANKVDEVAFSGIKTSAHNGNTYTLDVEGSDIKNMTFWLKDSNGDIVATAQNVDASAWQTGVANRAANKVEFDGVGTFTFTLNDEITSVSDLTAMAGQTVTFVGEGPGYEHTFTIGSVNNATTVFNDIGDALGKGFVDAGAAGLDNTDFEIDFVAKANAVKMQSADGSPKNIALQVSTDDTGMVTASIVSVGADGRATGTLVSDTKGVVGTADDGTVTFNLGDYGDLTIKNISGGALTVAPAVAGGLGIEGGAPTGVTLSGAPTAEGTVSSGVTDADLTITANMADTAIQTAIEALAGGGKITVTTMDSVAVTGGTASAGTIEMVYDAGAQGKFSFSVDSTGVMSNTALATAIEDAIQAIDGIEISTQAATPAGATDPETITVGIGAAGGTQAAASDGTLQASSLAENLPAGTLVGGAEQVTQPASRSFLTLTINGESVNLYKGDTYANFNSQGIAFEFDALSDEDIQNTNFFLGEPGDAAKAPQTVTISVNQNVGKDLIIQTGANEGDELGINIDRMSTETLGVSYSNIATREAASSAITEVNDAINKVSTQRAALGALQNRLDFKIANLDTSAENLQAAESRIRDVDMAKEMTAFSKKNILVQAATAMLAQANSAPQNVLQLLR